MADTTKIIGMKQKFVNILKLLKISTKKWWDRDPFRESAVLLNGN